MKLNLITYQKADLSGKRNCIVFYRSFAILETLHNIIKNVQKLHVKGASILPGNGFSDSTCQYPEKLLVAVIRKENYLSRKFVSSGNKTI